MSELPSLTELWSALFGEEAPQVKQPEVTGTKREISSWEPLKAMREKDASVMAETAKSEDPEAAAAVMWTLLNRSKRSGSVIPEAEALRPGQYHAMWRGNPSAKWTNYLDRQDYQRILALAKGVLDGTIPSPIGDRTHFHALGTPAPAWAPPANEWLTVGKSAFYHPVKNSSR